MAVMSAIERLRCFKQLVRDVAWPDLVKADVQAALNAADDWADLNASSYNLALPLPFRTTATSAQKALLLAYVCLRRANRTQVSEGE